MGWWACWGGLKMSSKSVRIDEDTFDRLQQIAVDEDRPMSRVVRAGVELYDQVKLAKIGRVPDQGPGGKSAPNTSGTGELGGSSVSTSQEPDCPHPKELRRLLSWGTLCRECGAVVE